MSSGSGINSMFPPRSSFFPAHSHEAAVICDFTPDLLLWDLGRAATPSAHMAAGEKEKWGRNRSWHLARGGRWSLSPLPDPAAAPGARTVGQGCAGSSRKPSPPCIHNNMRYPHNSCDSKALDMSMPCSSSSVVPWGSCCVLGGAVTEAAEAMEEAPSHLQLPCCRLLCSLLATWPMGDHSQPVFLLLHRADVPTRIFGWGGLTRGGNADDQRDVDGARGAPCPAPQWARGHLQKLVLVWLAAEQGPLSSSVISVRGTRWVKIAADCWGKQLPVWALFHRPGQRRAAAEPQSPHFTPDVFVVSASNHSTSGGTSGPLEGSQPQVVGAPHQSHSKCIIICLFALKLPKEAS